MAILRDTSLQSQWHYARLLITPTPSTISAISPQTPIDAISLLSLTTTSLADWFGPAGGISGVEVQVLLVEEPSPSSIPAAAAAAEPGAREAVLRFPASSAHLLLTSLPVTSASYDGQSYSIRVLASSDDLRALGGKNGRGKQGWEEWREGLRSA
ncbi:hypothetical protein BCR35DRAFT_120518 [Leucosporidium creatinivorum]|uniref:Uncharacterized protein n=1 Tax=Leucosporidium creatinivorum TaxID=106004 RepID=A0A1Y2F0N9_9BASI|nr:hypothetical protein BCR35DRAFT_120518 [Leucosporidium creatinivorum]